MTDAIIKGASGGKSGGGGGGLNEQPDTLKSTAYAQVLDLICEGEIGGLVDGLKSIYVDDVPIQAADGTMNFKNVSYGTVNGTQTQTAIAGFEDVSSEIAVGVEATYSAPVTRSITNTNVTSVIVTVQIPTLSYMDDKGNLGGASVDFKIEVNRNNTGWVTKVTDTITGKASSEYRRQYRIVLPQSGPWQIRLTRLTPDATTSSRQNKTYLYSYTEVVDAKLSYPNSALVALRIDASQFRSIPRRGYDCKLLKIRIPTNATVRSDGSLSYSGVWNGTFKTEWSSCPAWVYYDLLTNDRYGLGKDIDASQVDKWSLYEISTYCNALIDNGFGGTEPRMSCNVWMNNRNEAFKVLQDFASCFRGMAYWASDTITAVQDAPKDATMLFTDANVIDGMFSYQGSSAKQRHTVALVTWNDPADMFQQKVEYVEDTDGIARYGVNETEVLAFGCTSRGQAHRVGLWTLYSERYETEVVSFKVGLEGALCRPGDIIKVADRNRQSARTGGRVHSATSTTVTVDQIDGSPAAGHKLWVIGPDGVAQERTISSVSGNTITVTSAFTATPLAQSVYIISTTANAAQTFRVMAVVENESGEHEITAIEHNPAKYSELESNLNLTSREYSTLNPLPDTPTNLSLDEIVFAWQNTTRSKLVVSWDQAANAARYLVQWRVNDGNLESAETYATTFDIYDTIEGSYEVVVTSINRAGLPAAASISNTITTVGNNAAPATVSNLTATSVVGGVRLTWSTGASLGVYKTEIYENTTNNSATATKIATTSSDDYTRLGLLNANGARYYWVKLVNTQQVSSAFSNVASGTATDSAAGLSTATVFIYQRAASAPTLPSASVTFTFATGVITGLNNGWSATIPAGTNPLYVSAATASAAGATDTIAANEWSSAVVLAQNGSQGSSGYSSRTVLIYQRSTSSTAPTLPSATVTVDFTTGSVSGLNNGWTTSLPTTGGGYRWTSSATALGTGTTDTIANTEWSTAALLATDGSPGAAGRNAIVFNQTTTPTGAVEGDTWYNPSTKVWQQYTSGAWGALLGAMSSIDGITTANSTTYIGTSAIGSAQIGSLSVGKLTGDVSKLISQAFRGYTSVSTSANIFETTLPKSDHPDGHVPTVIAGVSGYSSSSWTLAAYIAEIGDGSPPVTLSLPAPDAYNNYSVGTGYDGKGYPYSYDIYASMFWLADYDIAVGDSIVQGSYTYPVVAVYRDGTTTVTFDTQTTLTGSSCTRSRGGLANNVVGPYTLLGSAQASSATSTATLVASLGRYSTLRHKLKITFEASSGTVYAADALLLGVR